MEETVYDSCVDDNLIADGTDYCDSNLLTNLNMSVWSDENLESACDEAVEAMQDYCEAQDSDEACYACAYTISYLFSKYDKYLESAFESIFTDISDESTATLQEAADMVAEDDDDADEDDSSDTTTTIELPASVS